MSDLSHARVAVFIDYQNCYGWARRAFHDARRDPPSCGHVHPRALADLLVKLGGRHRICSYAGVYVGMPNVHVDPATSAARVRQVAAWAASGVAVVTRPLRYLPGWPKVRPIEKGIDVKLALDAVVMAVAGEYDVAVVASCDSDFAPLVEALHDLRDRFRRPKAVEVVQWGGRGASIHAASAPLTTLRILPNNYAAIQDLTSYSN